MNKEEIAKSIDEGLKILKQEPSFVFNLEEIEAIQYLQIEIIDIQKDIDFHLDKENIISKEELKAKQTILSLISKLLKELDSQKQGNKDLVKEGVKLSAKIVELQKELEQEKEKNKKLNLENQALFESINCNDDNMLARRYSNLQKESDKKDKIINLIVNYLAEEDVSETFCKTEYFNIDCANEAYKCEDCIKEYFYKKGGEENV